MYCFQKHLFLILPARAISLLAPGLRKMAKKNYHQPKKHFLVKGLVSVVPNYVPKANNVSNL